MTESPICAPQLGLNPNSIFGGEVYDREILMGLAKCGQKILIILPKGKPHDAQTKNWDVSYVPFSRFPAFLSPLIYLPFIYKLYKKEKFSILFISQPYFLGSCALFFKLLEKKVKVIATYHQFSETKIFPMPKSFNKLFDHIICDSLNVKNRLSYIYGVNRDKITVVHNGFPKYLRPQKKDIKAQKKLNLQNKFVLLYMGLFIDRKNPLFLLEVLEELKKKAEDIVLIYWGEGPLKHQIIKGAKALKLLPYIRFIEPKFNQEKNKIHSLADVFVHPSLDEGFALAPLEAMACAKPVLMNNSHSAKEAIDDGKNGFICKTNNAKNWADKIMLLKKNRKTLESMSLSARRKALDDFSWEQSVNKILTLIQKLV